MPQTAEHKVARWVDGYYRVTVVDRDGWGNIHRRGREWHADIRNKHGELRRYAGIWSTLRDAAEECVDILKRGH